VPLPEGIEGGFGAAATKLAAAARNEMIIENCILFMNLDLILL